MYTDKDIEFAIKVITERSQLEDVTVKMWLQNPDNCLLIDIVAEVRTYFDSSDYEQFKQEVFNSLTNHCRENKAKRKVLHFSYEIASIFIVGLVLSLFFINRKVVLPVSDNSSQFELLSSTPYIVTSTGEKIELNEENPEVEVKTKGNVSTAYQTTLQNKSDLPDDNVSDTLLNTLVAPYGTVCHIYLSDGTSVWLNSGSKLKFPTFFREDKREVYVEGEVYFEVSRMENCPFFVYASSATIEVKGTSFNVRNYKDEDFFSASLLAGKILVDIPEGNKSIVLKPGYELYMEENNGEYILREVNVEEAILWIQGKFVFKTMSLDSIMKQLQRWYKFEVVYKEEKIKDYQFRGVLEREMVLEQILDIICETTYLNYQMEEGKITIYRNINRKNN